MRKRADGERSGHPDARTAPWHAVAGPATALLAAALIATALQSGGPWWCALLGGALLWRLLEHGGAGLPGLARRSAWVALALLPLPAYGYQGLLSLAPWAWFALLPVACLYAVVGAAASWCLARRQRAVVMGATPLGWCLGWLGLDLTLSHAAGAWLPVPVTIGYLMVDGPLVALAALGGPTALALGWVSSSAALAALPLRPGARGHSLGRSTVLCCLVAACCWLAVWALQQTASRAELGEARLVAVQQGLASEEELARTRQEPEVADALLRAYLQAAEALGAALGPVDLHVWPETALGFALADGAGPLAEASLRLGTPVLAGAYRPATGLGQDRTIPAEARQPAWHNSVALADGHRAGFVVDKRRLVPLYEAWLQPGLGELWPVRAAGLRWGVLICWESLFLDLALERTAAGAQALLVLIHDGWAGRTVTPWWHARSGRLVAWASGRPVVMASHDGPSMAWSHDGRLLATTEDGADGMAAALRAPLDWTTPYLRWGPGGVAVAYLVAWLVAWLAVPPRGAAPLPPRLRRREG